MSYCTKCGKVRKDSPLTKLYFNYSKNETETRNALYRIEQFIVVQNNLTKYKSIFDNLQKLQQQAFNAVLKNIQQMEKDLQN